MKEALTIGAHINSRINENHFEINRIPFLTNGIVAQNAYQAVTYAQYHLAGPDKLNPHVEQFYIEEAGLGKIYGIEQVYFKTYTCCRLIHEAIEAALACRAHFQNIGMELSASTVENIDITTIEEAVYTHNHVAANDLIVNKKYSLPYCVAAALLCGDVSKAQFEDNLENLHVIIALHHKINVRSGDSEIEAGYPEKSRRSSFNLTHIHGESFFTIQNLAKGEPENQLSDDELIAKFIRWTSANLLNEQQQAIIQYCFELELQNNMKNLAQLLQGDST